MENRAEFHNPHPESADYSLVSQWLAEAGITVDHVEEAPEACLVCPPPPMDVAA